MANLPIWPRPNEATGGESVVWISNDVSLHFTTATGATAEESWTDDLRADLQLLLFKHAFVPEKLHPPHQEFEPSVSAPRQWVKDIHVTVSSRDASESDEQYTIQLTSDKDDACIKCGINSFKGGYYALQTLRQLFYKHSGAPETVLYTPYVPIDIKDKPRFLHRGLNLDISRNRIGPKAVMRTIEGLASAKLNRLHLHAADSQSWPLEIPALPELAEKGAYHKSQVWSCADLEEVQRYGQRRGVEVFVELGMPGHMASIHHSHPELITGYDKRPWEPWAAEPPSGQLKLNSAPVIDFLKTLLGDILPRCAKFTHHFHIGADEINAKVYELDPAVRSSDPDLIRPGLQALINAVMAEITQAGLIPIAFEELLLDWNIELPKETIIQVWRSHENLARVVQKGHRAIFGPYTHWYLDAGHGGWVDPDPEKKDSAVKPPYLDWCSPYKNWRQICSYDPYEGVPSEFHHLIHGGETNLWCELTDEVNLDNKLWPRAAAAGETMWSGPQVIDEQMTRRLAEFRERLVLQGLGAAVVQMEWSLRNPGGSLM
jgi:hexosaminidase